MYITTEDYDKSIYPEIRQAISRNSIQYAEHQINIALALIQAKLSARYDILGEFAKLKEARNFLLVSVAKDIAIYYLYDTQESIPDHRVKKFDDAMEFLSDLATGKATLAGVPAAPLIADPTLAPRGNMAFGSDEKRNNKIY
jgi:phage gp36-like protein